MFVTDYVKTSNSTISYFILLIQYTLLDKNSLHMGGEIQFCVFNTLNVGLIIGWWGESYLLFSFYRGYCVFNRDISLYKHV